MSLESGHRFRGGDMLWIKYLERMANLNRGSFQPTGARPNSAIRRWSLQWFAAIQAGTPARSSMEAGTQPVRSATLRSA